MKHLFATLIIFSALAYCYIPASAAEILNRGLIAMHIPTGGNFVSWRLLPHDASGNTYDVVRNGKVIAANLSETNYTDVNGQADNYYQVVVKNADGETVETSRETSCWDNVFKCMKLSRPVGGNDYSYYPLEASVADVDNDGEWELVVKWTPTNSRDNSEKGVTAKTILDCYSMKEVLYENASGASLLWRIDLGRNIRSGSHYTQFLFYDFDNDGCAELICKTAPGSVDGMGNYVSEAADDATIKAVDNTVDCRDKFGRIMYGPEFLTVFEGATGKAIHTIWYNPNRACTFNREGSYSEVWGDDYANRSERYLAAVAHLAGKDQPASAVMCRGYYTRAYLWAVDFDGQKLSTRWIHASLSKTRVEVIDADGQKTVKNYNSNTSGKGDAYTAYGQGCHSVAAGDVDGDGCDEILYGSAAIDNDGSLLYSTGLGHGDAHHLGDFLPDRPGLEFFMPHEEGNNGWHLRDAATGELLLWNPMAGDTGAGLCGDIDPDYRGAEFWVADTENNVFDAEGNIISTNRPNYRFRIYWDGTLQDNVTTKTRITAYNKGANSIVLDAANCIKNGSKEPPVLQADLFGDWREEIIWCSSEDSCTLKIYSSPMETKYSVPTLMSDHLYRISVAWQNVAYNQPPHLSYYLADRFASRFNTVGSGQKEQTIALGQSIEPIVCELENCTSAMVYASYLNGTKVKSFGVPTGFNFQMDRTAGRFTLTGTPEQTGTYTIVVRSSGDVTGNKLEEILRITVTDTSSIETIGHNTTTDQRCFDLYGRQVNGMLRKGVYVLGRKKVLIK